MRKDVILAVADAIEKHEISDLGFNMNTFVGSNEFEDGGDKSGHNCGTVACIAGWTAALFTEDGKRRGSPSAKELRNNGGWIPDIAAGAMDLSAAKAEELFHPDLQTWSWSRVTPARAVKTLRRLAKTGMVQWT
jgi:hypothetical protein